jgi:hypothetical protein
VYPASLILNFQLAVLTADKPAGRRTGKQQRRVFFGNTRSDGKQDARKN